MSGAAKRVACTACGASITLRATGVSMAVACGHCGAIIDLHDPAHAVLGAEKRAGPPPILALGSKGTLRGVDWMILGLLRRQEVRSDFTWDEYLLFNPLHGFSWLVEANGHWSFARPLKHKAKLSEGAADQKALSLFGRHYRFFGETASVVVAVFGEFYWRVKVGDAAVSRDYVCPPEMLTLEKTADEVTQSLGEYLPLEVVQETFARERVLLPPVGIAPHQPQGDPTALRQALRIFLPLAICLGVIQLVTFFRGTRERRLFVKEFALAVEDAAPVFIDTVEIPGAYGDLIVAVEVPQLTDAWFELELDLVNADGINLPVEFGVEHYAGVEVDQWGEWPWTEGSRVGEHVIAAVPGGKYELIVRPTTNMAGVATLPSWFLLEIRRDTVIWLNAFLGMLALAAYPAWLWLRYARFERARWSGAPSEDEDDESEDDEEEP